MSPQTSPPVVEVAAERGALLDQLSLIAKALNALDSDLAHGNVLAAKMTSTELRLALVALTRLLGFA